MGQESIFTTEPVEPVHRDSVFATDADARDARSRPDRESTSGVNPVLDRNVRFDRRFDAATAALGLDPATLDFGTPTVTQMRVESAAEEATGEPDAVVEAARDLLVDVVTDPSAYPLQF